MKQIIPYQNKNQNGHQCQTMIIHCIDWRFQGFVSELLNQMFADEGGVADFDRLGVGGASKAILDEITRPTVIGAVSIAMEKHQVKRLIIIDHIDCGAYGGSGQHQNPEIEEKFHTEKLFEAKKILREEFPSLEIITLYQDWAKLKPI